VKGLAALALLLPALAWAAAGASEPPVLPEPPEVSPPDAPKPREPPPAGKPPTETPAGTPKAGPDDEAITVVADQASSQRAGADAAGHELTRARFTGNVDARRGDVKLTCRQLEVTFAAGEGNRRRPQSARATGQVVIAMPGRRAVAEEALYDMAGELITLSGKTRPVLYHQNDAVAAESFLIHRLKRLVEARGRVSAEIAPRQQAKPGAKPDPKGLPAGPSAAKRTRLDAAGGGIYADATHQLFLKDAVVVQQEGFRLACDRLWVFLRPQEEKKPAARPEKEKGPTPEADPLLEALGAGALRKITAAGRVRIETDTRQVEAELAEYRAEGRTIILAGVPQPVIREGQSLLTAPQIIYYLDEDRVESRGGPFKAVLRGEKPGGKPPPPPAPAK